MTSKFDRLKDLKGTGNQELAGAPEDAQEVAAAATWEIAELPAFPPTSEVTTFSAQMPLSEKMIFEQRVVSARFVPGLSRLEAREGARALVRLLKDPEVVQKWYAEMLDARAKK